MVLGVGQVADMSIKRFTGTTVVTTTTPTSTSSSCWQYSYDQVNDDNGTDDEDADDSDASSTRRRLRSRNIAGRIDLENRQNTYADSKHFSVRASLEKG